MNDISKKILKAFWVINRKINRHKLKSRYLQIPTELELRSYISKVELTDLYSSKDTIFELAELYKEHFFDILGSGWKKSFCSFNKEVDESLADLITSDYQFINWHQDIKTGFVWPNNVWYSEINYQENQGNDIKVPWELARMQHLIYFCFACGLSDNKNQKDKYFQEFKNQVLDFIINNPPYYGVNWLCAMEVGIRVVNWLICYDLFKCLGCFFDNKFLKIFTKSIYQHGLYIFENLENPPDIRGNHYLANLCGLIYVSSYLSLTEETEVWLNFAYKELIKEVAEQFNEDGTNIEASSAYHCLSSELVLYATALLLNKKNHKIFSFPKWYYERLIKAFNFIIDIRKTNGEIILIGDNDSGRLIKSNPGSFSKVPLEEVKGVFANLRDYVSEKKYYLLENSLKKDDLIASFAGFFDNVDLNLLSNSFSKSLLFELKGGYKIDFATKKEDFAKKTANENINIYLSMWQNANDDQKQKYVFQLPENWNTGLTRCIYEDFGLYIYHSDVFFLSIRCGGVCRNTKSGHAHNDQLSIILSIEGKDIILDPGSYLYTSNYEIRNNYRSVTAHFTPQCEGVKVEQEKMVEKELFKMKFKSKPECIYFNMDGFIGFHEGFGFRTYRVVIFYENQIEIYDFFDKGMYKMKKLPLKTLIPYSPFYGWVYNE